MKHAQSQGPSQRQLRAGELIRHALAEVFLRGEASDPDLDRLTPTVVEVQISPDLKIATAFVRTLLKGKDNYLLETLNRNKNSTSWSHQSAICVARTVSSRKNSMTVTAKKGR